MSDERRITPGDVIVLLAIFVAIGVVVVLIRQPADVRTPPALAAPLTAIVVSEGAVAVGRVHGGTQAIARVRLANGTIVNASVTPAAALTPGEPVTVVEEDNGFGPVTYRVTAVGGR
jgi:hypothetical protein